MDKDESKTARGAETGIRKLAVEEFDLISDQVIRSAITKDPAQTARNIADYKTVSRSFKNSVERNTGDISEPRTETGQFINRLGRLGDLAKQMHEMAFPKEGLSSTDFDIPGSGSTRIEAGGRLVAFQSEARKAKLVQDILGIKDPGERMNSIAGLIHNGAFKELEDKNENKQLEYKYQKPIIDEVFRAHLEEPRISQLYIGERPTANMIVDMEKQLQPEHLQQLGAMAFTHPDKLQEIIDARASSIEYAARRGTEDPVYGPKQQIDRHIDYLEERVKQLKPIEDLGHPDSATPVNDEILRKHWSAIHEMGDLSKEILSTYHDARMEITPRQEVSHQERERDTRGR